MHTVSKEGGRPKMNLVPEARHGMRRLKEGGMSWEGETGSPKHVMKQRREVRWPGREREMKEGKTSNQGKVGRMVSGWKRNYGIWKEKGRKEK